VTITSNKPTSGPVGLSIQFPVCSSSGTRKHDYRVAVTLRLMPKIGEPPPLPVETVVDSGQYTKHCMGYYRGLHAFLGGG
jgi:hypothetical protein